MSEVSMRLIFLFVSMGLMIGQAHAATPHPLTLGLRAVELSCSVDAEDGEAKRQFQAAYCREMSRLVGERLGVAVESVEEAGPAPAGALPSVGIVWIRSSVELSAETATAHTAWGSHMRQRGVPASQEAAPVSLPIADSDVADVGRALADQVVSRLPFVRNG